MNRDVLATVAAVACVGAALALPRPQTGAPVEAPARPAARLVEEPPGVIPVINVYLQPDGHLFRGSWRLGAADAIGEDPDPWHRADAQGWGPWAIHQVVRRVGFRPPEDGDYLLRPSEIGRWLLPISPWLAAAALEEDRYFSAWEVRYARDAGADDALVRRRARELQQALAEAIIAADPEHSAAEISVISVLQDKELDFRDEGALQREALDAMHEAPSHTLARAHLSHIVNEPKIDLSEEDFALLADLLEGYEAKWPRAVLFAAQAAYEQGKDTARWVARGDRALQCGTPEDRHTCQSAHELWHALRPLMAPPTHWIEAIHAATRSCTFPPGARYHASGRYRGGWALRAHDGAHQTLFDCVVRAIGLPAEEGQHVHLNVFAPPSAE